MIVNLVNFPFNFLNQKRMVVFLNMKKDNSIIKNIIIIISVSQQYEFSWLFLTIPL